MTWIFKKYSSPTFIEVFPDLNTFSTSFKGTSYYSLLDNEFSDGSIAITYSLLVAKYGNNPIANFSEDMFKNKLFSIIYEYGPTWQSKLFIQKKLRTLTEDEILLGTTTIYNRASNPEQAPTTDTLDELTYINDQNTQKFKKNKSTAYAELYSILQDNISDVYIGKFKVCFRQIVSPDFVFVDEEDEEDET